MNAYARRAHVALKPLTVREERAIARVSSLIERRARLERQNFSSPSVASEFFKLRLAALEYEVFEVAFLDQRNSLLACETMFRGTVHQATVHIREVMRRALILNAAAIVVAHNHPSGNPEPSKADITLTSSLQQAALLLEIRLIDHIVVGGKKTVSFAQKSFI